LFILSERNFSPPGNAMIFPSCQGGRVIAELMEDGIGRMAGNVNWKIEEK